MLAISDKDFFRLRALIHERFGIYLSDAKKLLVQGRLNKEIRAAGHESFAAYVADLERTKDAEKMLGLIDRISTNHSFFFREADHFDLLVETILPDLLRNGVEPRELRIWSAGAADGQEAYTIAMVLHERFGARVGGRRPVILATDISVSSLGRAVQGVYPEAVLTSVPVRYRGHLVPAGAERVRISDEIRKMVMFKRLNLNRPHYPFKNRFHVVFCRNVMIYFDRATRNEVVERFGLHTLPGGYLLIGHSESLGRDVAAYRYLRPTVYQRYR